MKPHHTRRSGVPSSSLRIFVAVPALPKADESAGDRRLVILLEMLAKQHRVDLWAFDQADPANVQIDRHIAQLKSMGIRVLPFGWTGFVQSLFTTCYHIGLFEFFDMVEGFGGEFRKRQPGALVVVDSVDVHFAREIAGAEVGVLDRSKAEETRKRELYAYRSADAVIVVSDQEADILGREGDVGPLFVVPMILPARPRPICSRDRDVLFIGGFKHLPNVDGLSWFVDRSWPHIRAMVPDATLTVIGSHPPPEVLALRHTVGIDVLGHVPDTSPFLDRAAIAIAPLRYGGGMKGKVVEALSCGIPLVTTTVGLQGINAQAGVHVAVADDAAEFAKAVADLLVDPDRAARMGLAGQRLSVQVCGPERAERSVQGMLATLVPNPKGLKIRLDWLRAVAVNVCATFGRKIWSSCASARSIQAEP